MGTISMADANAISSGSVVAFGLGLTFVGLICIIIICMIMGAICQKFVKNTPAAPAAAAAPAPKKAEIANKGEFVAAVAAAIAEDLGTDVSGIRIHSIKQL